MDVEIKYAAKVLETLADINARLIELALVLERRSEVVRVLHDLECWEYQTGTVLEGYVDVELRNGKAMAWWLEVCWDEEQWLIESRVLVNDDQGQDTVREFPDRGAQTLDGFVKQLQEATSQLVNSIDVLDLLV